MLNNYSTFFRTVQDFSTRKTQIKMSGLDLFKKQDVFSKTDIEAFKAFNAELENGTKYGRAIQLTMGDASKSARDWAAQLQGAKVELSQLPKTSKIATMGINALTTAMNIGLNLAIIAFVSGVRKAIGAYDEMSQHAQEATSKFKEQSSSINDYKDRVTELKTALLDENLTYADARIKREELISIQKELIDTYGAEAEGIDIVNGSLDEQIKKLDAINSKKRQKWENEINQLSTGQQWQKWLGYAGLGLLDIITLDWGLNDAREWLDDFDNTTNIERIQEKVENFKKSVSLKDLDIDTEALENLKTQLDSYEGVSIDGLKMTIEGDVKTVSDTITSIQTEVIGSREDLQAFNKDLGDIQQTAQKIIDQNWDTYNQALENKVLDDDEGFKYYESLIDAYNAYQEAVKDGDEAAVERAKENYSSLLSEIDDSDMSEQFKRFFENMYPDIAEVINNWIFEVKVVPKIETVNSNLKGSIDKLGGMTTEEIKSAFDNNGSGIDADKWEAINALNTEAQSNGMSLETLLDQLREAGYLLSQLDKDIDDVIGRAKTKFNLSSDDNTVNDFFSKKSIDTQEELDLWERVTRGAKTAQEAMDRYSEAVKKATDSTSSLKSKLDNLDGMSKSFKSLKTAMDEIADDGKVSFSTVKELSETLGDDIVEKYSETLLDASSSAQDLSKAITSMTQDYINARIAAGDFNDADEKMIASMLDEAGIANSVAVAHDMVTRAKFLNELQTIDLSKASDAEKQRLQAEAEACGITANEFTTLAQLQAAAQLAMTSSAMTETLARLGIMQSELAAIQTLQEAYNKIIGTGFTYTYDENGNLTSAKFNDEGKKFITAANSIIAYNEQIEKLKQNVSTPTFKPSSTKSSGGSSNKSGKDNAKKADDAQKAYDKKVKDINKQLDDLAKSEALDEFKYKFDQIEESISKVDDALNLLRTTLDLQAEDDYIGRIETVTRQIDLTQEKVGMLVDEFNQLKSVTPVSADMAKEIASRMSSVAESIATNRKEMIEYAKNVTDYYMSAMKSIGSVQKETADKATSLYERNIQTLEKGGLMGLRFSISPTVSQDAYERQRDENQALEDEMREYYDTVNAMQKTALDMQYKEQVEDNERKRQELYESLEEAKETLNEALAEATESTANTSATIRGIQQVTDANIKAEQQATNAATSAEQQRDDAEKVAETENFSATEEGIITDLNNWMIEHPIPAPGLDTSSWEAMVDEAKNYAQQIKDAVSEAEAALDSVGDGESSTHISSSGTEHGGGSIGSSGSSSSGGDKAANVVETARKLLGTPYKWGGTTPAGFDCSGFVQYVYAQNGIGISRTTYTQIKDGKAVSKSDLRAGDLVFFGDGKSPSHVGMYVGNGQFIHAPHTGDVVKYSNLNSNYYTSHYMGARRILYAKGTKDFDVYGANPNGVAGENYRSETLINKKTGKTTIIDEPTLVDTNQYDVIGENQTAQILGKKYATGTPTTDAEILSYIKKASEETGVPANILMAVMDQETGYKWYGGIQDGKYKSYGYMMMNEGGGLAWLRSIGRSDLASAAKTDKYSNVLGAAMLLNNLYKTNGNNWQRALVRYNGSGNKAEKYGSQVYNRAFSSAFQEAAASLKNISSSTSKTSDNTADTAAAVEDNTDNTVAAVREVRNDFRAQLKEILAGETLSISDANGFEEGLLSYIKENVQIASDNNEKFVEAFDKMQAYQEASVDKFKSVDESLIKAVGTDGFISARSSASEMATAYVQEVLKMQSDLALAQYKDAYNMANDALMSARKYYNLRNAEGAGADELKIIAESIDAIQNEMGEISDKYVSQIEAETQYLVGLAERVVKPISDELTWLEKTNEELERQQELAQIGSEKMYVMTKREANYNKMLDENRKKQEAAHAAVLDLYNDEKYDDVFKRFDMESWFDASGDFSAQFTSDLERMSNTMPEIVPVMHQVAELIQVQKKAYYEAGKEIDNFNDALKDIAKSKADERIAAYVKIRERTSEAVSFDKSINDALTNIQQSFYDYKDTLREVQNDIDAELEANKHLDQWLSPDTRKQLFNEEDYAEETLVISNLLAESENLRLEYQKQISSLREDEQWKLEGITAEYTKQMDALKNQLSIAKQRLQTAKDMDAIENARKERDTQIIMGNRVQNVADPDRLYELEKVAQQSRLELINQETKEQEAADIRNMERVSDQMNTVIENIRYTVDAINNLPEAEREAFADKLPSIEEMEAMYYSVMRDSIHTILTEDLTDGAFAGLDFDKRIGYSTAISHSWYSGLLREMLDNGFIEDSPAVRQAIYGNEQNHDNKTLTDPDHAGYPLFGVGEYIGTGVGLLVNRIGSYVEYMAEQAEFERKAVEWFKQAFLDEWNNQQELKNHISPSTVISGEGDVQLLVNAHDMDGSGILPNGTVITGGVALNQDPDGIDPDTIVSAGEAQYLIETSKLKNAKVLPNGTVISGEYMSPHTIETTGDMTITGDGGIVINGEVFTVKDWNDMPEFDVSAIADTPHVFTGSNIADILRAAETHNDYSRNFHIDRLEVINPTSADDVINGLLNQTESFAKTTNNMR